MQPGDANNQALELISLLCQILEVLLYLHCISIKYSLELATEVV